MKNTKFSKLVSEKVDLTKFFNVDEALGFVMEFKKESFYLFDAMIEAFKDDIVKILFNIKIQTMSPKEFEEHKRRREQNKS